MAQRDQIKDPNTGTAHNPMPDPARGRERRAVDETVVAEEGLPGTTDERVAEEVGMVRGGTEEPPRSRSHQRGASASAQTGGTSRAAEHPERNTDPEIASIRADIGRTRQETARTIDAIQRQLSPATLKVQARDKVKEMTVDKAKAMTRNATDLAKDTGVTMFETIKDNLIPTILITSGIAWLIKDNNLSRDDGGRRPIGYPPHVYPDYDEWAYAPDEEFRAMPEEADLESYERSGGRVRRSAEGAKARARDAGHRVSDATRHARERAAHMASGTRERVGHMRHGISRRASAFGEESRYHYRRARRGFFDTMNENPLALAGAALAVGTLFGLAVPETEREREWMGDTRDELLHEAKEKGTETLEKAQHVAEHAAESAAEAAKAEARRQDLVS